MPTAIPIDVDVPIATCAQQPVTFGVPMPRGALHDPTRVKLTLAGDKPLVTQSKALATWPDGSVRWLLVDTILPPIDAPGTYPAALEYDVATPADSWPEWSHNQDMGEFRYAEDGFGFRAGRVHTRLFSPTDERLGFLIPVVLDHPDHHGKFQAFRSLEANLVRTTYIADRAPLRRGGLILRIRWSLFGKAGLARADVTLTNPRPARHKGGLWDLGDPGSTFINELSVLIASSADPLPPVRWSLSSDDAVRSSDLNNLSIHQHSSGGPHASSRNHVDAAGNVTVKAPGYEARLAGRSISGNRCNPTIHWGNKSCWISVTRERFWQEFPSSIERHEEYEKAFNIGLIPPGLTSPFELQGGERKTWTVWLRLQQGEPNPRCLDWVHAPALVHIDPEWMANSGTVPQVEPPTFVPNERLATYAHEALEGPSNLFWKREEADEYGWRHFGDVWGDHEEAYYDGPKPIVSHYNNQYDLTYSFLLWWWITGDRRWWQLAEPLARHTMDIDTYHTKKDRAAYNGGLFWHTDHYKDAATATHRTYSKKNAQPGKSYGGGPSAENNYPTGLAHFYYQTGDEDFREAILELANWVIQMDDDPRDILAIFDRGPTGLASATREPDYHGPGRGAGNSIQCLTEAFLLTDDRRYLLKAEELIRRTVHPNDNIGARELLDAERRWSYIMYFASLARYLDAKWMHQEFDESFWYARGSLIAYADWMAGYETPFFDRRASLEYPTETWACLDVRKANVLTQARRFLDPSDTDRLQRYLSKATALAERGWQDAHTFGTKHVTRAIAVLLLDGWKDSAFRESDPRDNPRQTGPLSIPFDDPIQEFPPPIPFLSRKDRVKAQLRTPAGLIRGAAMIAFPTSWPKIWRFVRQRFA